MGSLFWVCSNRVSPSREGLGGSLHYPKNDLSPQLTPFKKPCQVLIDENMENICMVLAFLFIYKFFEKFILKLIILWCFFNRGFQSEPSMANLGYTVFTQITMFRDHWMVRVIFKFFFYTIYILLNREI